MKASRSQKLQTKLEAAEAELVSLLLRVLPSSAESGSGAFDNSEFNPGKMNLTHLSSNAERLLELARESVAIEDQLGGGTLSIGRLYLAACHEHVSVDEHRRGPRRLAEWLLGEVQRIASQ